MKERPKFRYLSFGDAKRELYSGKWTVRCNGFHLRIAVLYSLVLAAICVIEFVKVPDARIVAVPCFILAVFSARTVMLAKMKP